MQLRAVRDDDLPALLALAEAGVHDPQRMPFSTPWTDAPAGELPINFLQYHWRNRAEFRPESWSLELAVFWHGRLVGTQGFTTCDYLVTRTGETGSWLGRAFHNQGLGTRMRQAICAFLFDDLDAEEITSAAFIDNPESLAVSRKVGYVDNGTKRLQRRPGEMAVNRRLVLTPDALVRPPDPVAVRGAEGVRKLIGLD